VSGAGDITGPVSLRLRVRPGAAVVRVCFHNVGAGPVRLLAQTEPAPVFFSFDIVDETGTPVPTRRGGKIDFGPGPLPYVEVPPGGDWCVDVDLAEVAGRLAPARYRVAVTYHNQYGDGCLTGRLTAAPVGLDLR
jgi:hypothetical protein